MKHKVIALIPARSGSKRIPNKNIKPFFGHPLLAYTIAEAKKSGIFDKIYVATDSEEYADLARGYGAEVPALRDPKISGSNSPDVEWVSWLLGIVNTDEIEYFCILRPTSPFRTSNTIIRAWKMLGDHPNYDTLRAVELCSQHPGKMWIKNKHTLTPILPYNIAGVPWHSNQYSALPEVYVQNACIEISKISCVKINNSITGERILAFETVEFEGLDLNTVDDWDLALKYVNTGKVNMPKIIINN